MSKKDHAPPTGEAYMARLREIVRIMEASSLSSLHYEDADIEVRLTRGVDPEPDAAPSDPPADA